MSYAGSLSSPSFTCQVAGLEGGDNQAINNLWLASSISGLTSAGNLGVVVNISEGKPGNTATLTGLYLNLYNLDTHSLTTYAYAGGPLVLGDSGGVGQSGANLFVLNTKDGQAAARLPGPEPLRDRRRHAIRIWHHNGYTGNHVCGRNQ